MVFSSLTFLYLFLPLAVLPYFLVKNRTWRNGLLLVLSLFFYAWGEPKYVVMMLAATVVAYAGGLVIETLRGRPKARKVAFVLTVCLVTANLLVFKYANFLWDTLNSIVSTGVTLPTIALPIGISFYTFQILSYVIDLYWGKVHVQRNFFYLLLYVSFFPQLIAGPIVRYSTIEDEILHRKETWDDVEAGLKRFLLGLAKKVLIANNVAAIADMIYQGNQSIYGTALYWLASVAYTMQIYFDFSGYSDMAIGLGRMFGFHFLENFNYPYLSRSSTEFWRRWHISLSSWRQPAGNGPDGAEYFHRLGPHRLLARSRLELSALGPVLRCPAGDREILAGEGPGQTPQCPALVLHIFRGEPGLGVLSSQ